MLPIISSIIALSLATYFIKEQKKHHKKIHSVKHRIHVNGIRGKSSVTRLIASILKEAKIKYIGKATGSDTNIITHEGKEIKIHRKGPADVFENVRVLKTHLKQDIEAIVFECMAIQPRFQRFLEEKVMKSTIGIITNIREDHMEELGYSLEKITRSLSVTIPKNGYLICSDDNKKIQKLLKQHCKKKNTKFINALNYKVEDSYIANFPYFEHKENIAIGLAVAAILKIPKEVALQGMKNVIPDKGSVFINKYKVGKKTIIWANLFAANDKQSVVKCVNMLFDRFKQLQPETVCLLNNRSDRPERAKQFSEIASRDLLFNHIATIGDLQKQVISLLRKKHFKNIIPLADKKKASGETLIKDILQKTSKKTVLILGMANIHTSQATLVMDYFDNQAKRIN